MVECSTDFLKRRKADQPVAMAFGAPALLMAVAGAWLLTIAHSPSQINFDL